MTWEWNFVISLINWAVLYPLEGVTYNTKIRHWLEVMDHVCPLVYVTIDWALCRMQYERSSIGINMIIVALYGLVNIAYTKITGTAVYPPVLNFDYALSWSIGFAFVPLFASVFYLEYWLTTLKMKRINREKTEPAQRIVYG
jgi:hypothetical protein